MQYILTQEEYDELLRKNVKAVTETEAVIQKLCTEIAIHKPFDREWDPDSEAGFGCIRTLGIHRCAYCYGCPVEDVCPYENKRYPQ